MSTILLIEDEPTLRITFRHVLVEAGYRVVVATDGSEALGMLDFVTPHLVITDIMLPHKDGFSVIKLLRERFPDLSIIAMSGSGQGKLGELCTSLGADRFLAKPVNMDVLLATVLELAGPPLLP